MFELAAAERENLLQRGISRRLANRLAAWQAAKIAITETVLESASAHPAVEKFLLAKPLLARQNFSENFHSLLASPEFSAIQDDFDFSPVALADWLIVASADEIAAESAAPVSLPAAANFSPVLSSHNLSQIENSLLSPFATNSANLPTTFGASSPISNIEAERLRVQIFTAAAIPDRVAALRQFAFSALADEEKLRVFLSSLAEDNGELRAAAAKGLAKLGIAADFSDTLSALAMKSELRVTLERLRDLTLTADPLAQTATVMTAIGCIKDSTWRPAEISEVLAMLTTLVQKVDLPLWASRDFWRVLQTQMLAANDSANFRAIFSELAKKNPALVSHFCEEITKSNSAAYRGLLFNLLIDWELNAADRQKLLASAIAVFAEEDLGAESSFAARKFIGDCGESGLLALNAEWLRFDVAHQRAAARFLDNQTRGKNPLLPLAKNACALLANSPLALRLDLLETQMCLRGDLPDDLRLATTEILVGSYADYVTLSTTYLNALVRLKSPAPIVAALRREKDATTAAVFAEALGKIGENNLPLTADLLRELAKINFGGGAASEPAALAMSVIASKREVSETFNSFARRALTEQLRTRENSANLLIAVSRTLRGNFPDNDETADSARLVTALAFRHLSAQNSSDGIAAEQVDGETMFSFDERADLYAELVPAAIDALQNTAIGYAPARSQIIAQLLKLAAQPEFIAIAWGLANETKLLAALGKIGAADCSENEREKIAVMLARRIEQTAAMQALAEVLQNHRGTDLFDRLAVSLISRLIKLLKREKNLEERETYLRILTLALRRGGFIKSATSSQKNGSVEDLLAASGDIFLSAIRDGLSGAWQKLQTLLDEQIFGDSPLAERLTSAMAAMRAVTTIRPTNETE